MKNQAPIGVIHISTAASWRGGEQQLWYLAGELQEQGFLQMIWCPAGSPLAARTAAAGIPVTTFTRRTAFSLSAACRLLRLVKQNPGVILHAHDSHAHTMAVIASSLTRTPAPVIVSRRVDFAPGKGWLSNWKYRHQAVKKIICVSEKIKEIMAESLGDPSRLVTIHSGIDPGRFAGEGDRGFLRREFSLPEEVVLAGNTSAVADHKDYFTFVDTAEILLSHDSRFRFFIIGDGPLYDTIAHYIASKNLSDRIIMTGFRADIPRLLPGLDIFLMTSKTEGLGTTVLDAFACRVPVVATDAGGIPEMVENGVTGLLAPVGTPGSLAEQVLRILREPGLRDRLIANAAERLNAFSKHQTALKTLEVYGELQQQR